MRVEYVVRPNIFGNNINQNKMTTHCPLLFFPYYLLSTSPSAMIILYDFAISASEVTLRHLENVLRHKMIKRKVHKIHSYRESQETTLEFQI